MKSNNNSIVKNTAIILILSVLAKFLSYIWEAVLAAHLGTSDEADALYMTIGIFNVLYPILDLGIWKVFLPIYKKKMIGNDKNKPEQFANVSETLFLFLSILLVLFIIVFARPLTLIIAPGYTDDLKAMTIKYLRMSAPTYLLMASSSVIGAVLQCYNKFLGSQIRELGTHISKIIFFLFLYSKLGVYTAIYAMIIGSVFRLLVQLPFIDWGWKFKPDFNFKSEDVKTMLKGLPSVAVTAAIDQLNSLIDKIVASNLISGSVSSLNYGNKLSSVFSGMITNAVGTATYPSMAQYAAENNKKKLAELIKKSICVSAYFIIPISIVCILLSKEIVSIAFERGAFDSAAVNNTSGVFANYSIGILFIGCTMIISNVFYSYGDTKITMKISILEIVFNIILDLVFTRFMSVSGLALATSVSAIMCFILRLIILKRFVIIDYKDISVEMLKILFASIISCSIPYIAFFDLLHLNIYISLLLSAVFIGILYLVFSKVMNISTFNYAKTMIIKKLKG